MATSNYDKPLDELMTKNQWGRYRRFKGRNNNQRGGMNQKGGGANQKGGGANQKGGGANQKGVVRGGGTNQRGGGRANVRGFSTQKRGTQMKENGLSTGRGGGGGGGDVNDLRDVIILKTKPSVTDLRFKLPPKPIDKSSKKGVTKPTTTTTSSSSRERPSASTRSARSSNVFSNNKKVSPPSASPLRRLPTSSEAKKITVTVQGLNKTTSEVYRKEERLAATISRQKETRQQNFMKSREEFIASTITSALAGGMVPPQLAASVRNSAPSFTTRYHHSPSPPPEYIPYQPYEPRPQMIPNAPPPPRQRSLTTITTLVISNLNDTVSQNDVYELCSAVGPIEGVAMIAPGVAEVTYKYKDDALEAYRKYNQRNLDGMPMVCRLQSGASGGRARGPGGMEYMGGGGRPIDPYTGGDPSLFNTAGLTTSHHHHHHSTATGGGFY